MLTNQFAYNEEHFFYVATTTYTRPPTPKLDTKKKVKDKFYTKNENVSSEYVFIPGGFATGRQRAFVRSALAAELAAPREPLQLRPGKPNPQRRAKGSPRAGVGDKQDGDAMMREQGDKQTAPTHGRPQETEDRRRRRGDEPW